MLAGRASAWGAFLKKNRYVLLVLLCGLALLCWPQEKKQQPEPKERQEQAPAEDLEKRLEDKRFLFGDYVTDSDVRLYVTLARLDIRYTWQLGHTKHRLIDYPNLWGYARDLYQIPAFRNNTYFKDFANPNNKKVGALFFESFNARFLDEINFDAYWGAPHDRAHLSSDPGNKFKAEEQ